LEGLMSTGGSYNMPSCLLDLREDGDVIQTWSEREVFIYKQVNVT
jgi:hypothetical protein